ncbi:MULTISPECIES: HlyD family secretion protein [Sphingomonas]|uniref:HlyD family secretion protein n=1 Tax=Edaphosphingomonas fennica TaxID=114404 RepID=A0A2T4I6A8_9SPHN|nr:MULTISPECIES: HlyD family secretion protein [Sphingomonas]AGH48339.1 secretion protein HlyD family protein [Sphingomonas sp. MM-1]MDX3883524.1 HlyD family secretion protein [Sphingomonas sp.]PTD26161.1 HlyD family secretion protein [Sphingomonas fennica]
MNDMTSIKADGAAEVAGKARSRWRWPLMLSVPAVILAGGGWLWATSGRSVSTDNAQVGADIISISPEVGGRIVEVAVRENQRVKKGDLLFRIDPEPYRIALAQAEADVGNARIQVNEMSSTFVSKEADIGAMASDVQLAQENFARQKDLLDKGFTTRAAYDAARAALASAEAKRAVASADANAARAKLGTAGAGLHPQIAAAIAARDKAALDLARTEIRAPADGVIVQVDKLQPGSMAIASLTSATLVAGGNYWVDANFKETQLAHVRVGQKAEIAFDAMDGKACAAHVASIGSGTGSQFSMLPAQNATGNWVKVTQRVPVRLKLDCTPDRPLVAGSSADVTVHVRS